MTDCNSNGVMSCPCGEGREKLTPFYDKGETDFRLCPACDCVFREKFPNAEELEQIYQQAYADESIDAGATNQESGDYALQSYAAYLLKHTVFPDKSFLDYGAGSGVLVEEMRKKGVDAQGVEFSASAREFCKEKRGFDLQDNLKHYADEKFDVVSMIEVIEHLTDLSETLKDLHRVVRKGGVLFITTPNREGFRARREKGYWREACKKFHLFLFNQKSLEYHLKRAGFTDIQRIVFSPLQKPGLLFSLYSRTMQTLGLSGTLCIMARKK